MAGKRVESTATTGKASSYSGWAEGDPQSLKHVGKART